MYGTYIHNYILTGKWYQQHVDGAVSDRERPAAIAARKPREVFQTQFFKRSRSRDEVRGEEFAEIARIGRRRISVPQVSAAKLNISPQTPVPLKRSRLSTKHTGATHLRRSDRYAAFRYPLPVVIAKRGESRLFD